MHNKMLNTKMSPADHKSQNPMSMRKVLITLSTFFSISLIILQAQPSQKLTLESISKAIEETRKNAPFDPSRPGYHLVPKAGFMGDPNGGMYYQGWYHVFYLYNPFSYMPGPWCWSHAVLRSLEAWKLKTINKK
jgi:sucrose-6-phosphate hydrolase SacC (GH32 family)